MKLTDLYIVISFAAPLSSSLVCMILLIIRYKENDRYGHTKHYKLLILYFFILSFLCAVVLFNLFRVFSVNLFTNALFMLSSMYTVVIFYNIVYLIMSTRNRDKIAKIHYFIPLVVMVIYLFLFHSSSFEIFTAFPFSGFFDINTHWGQKLAFTSKYWIWLDYKIVYSFIVVRQLFIYRKQIVNYSAEQDRTSMNWLVQIIGINIIFIPLTILQLLFDSHNTLVPPLVYITNLMIMLQSIILFYNMFINNYIIIAPENDKVERGVLSLKIDKSYFETYMAKEKPYLNPGLRITDMIIPLGTNRTYLSKFINSTYGMSFSSYINDCRENELKRLQLNPKMISYSHEDLVIMAGFTSYRGYKRFVKEKKSTEPFW